MHILDIRYYIKALNKSVTIINYYHFKIIFKFINIHTDNECSSFTMNMFLIPELTFILIFVA